MAKTTRDRVFLSYAHEDLDAVRRIYKGLKERQLKVWFDKEHLKPGEWMPQIEKAIPRSRYFIICISSAALLKTGDDKPGFIDKELNAAYKVADRQSATEFTIVPVRLEDCDRGDFRISSFQHYDLFENFEKGLDKLAVHLGGLSLSDDAAKDERSEEDKKIDNLMGRATAAFYADIPEKAIHIIQAVLAIEPKNALAWDIMGAALDKIGLHKEALDALDNAQKIDPFYHSIWYNKVTVYSKLNYYEVQFEHVDDPAEQPHPSFPDSKILPLFLLPRRPEYFINRKSELAKLMKELYPGAITALCGPGGIGKTAIAVEIVYRLRDDIKKRFPDGVIFHSFYREPAADSALEQIARVFGEDVRPSPAASAQRALSQRQTLLILDGAEDADDLRKVLDVAAGCGVLITSRLRQDANTSRQDLKVLTSEHSRELLKAWGKVQAADEAATKQISDHLGGLPLALRLAGEYMEASVQNAAEYLSWLKESVLEALDHGEHRFESLPTLLERSLEQVSALAREVLGLAGILAFASFTREPIATVLELKASQLVKPLGELINYGLLLRSGERYEISHALIHTYAYEHLPPPKFIVERLVSYYIDLAKTKCQKGIAEDSMLKDDQVHLMRIAKVCKDQQLWQALYEMVATVEDYLDNKGFWRDRPTLLQAGVKATRKLNDRKSEGIFLGYLGIAHYRLGRFERAIFYCEQALAIHREIGDRKNEGNRLSNIGLSYHGLGQLERAIEYFEYALKIHRDLKNKREEANQLGNLGMGYKDLGKYEKAIEFHRRALAISRKIEDRKGEGNHLGNLGSVCYDMGQFDIAIKHQKQALRIHREIGYRYGEGALLGNIGEAYSSLGDVLRARRYLKEAIAILEDIKSPQADPFKKLLAKL